MIATNRKQLDNISYLTNAKVGIFWFLPATGTLPIIIKQRKYE